MIQVSVVIVNYNVSAFLQLCLQSVTKALKFTIGEIIVVDNNSDDDSCQMVKTFFPEVVLIENTTNVGFSKANNQGVDKAKGKYVLILNPDTVIPEQTFVKLINHYKVTNDIGAIGVALYDGTGAFLPESKRNIPYPKVALQKLLGNNKSYYASLKEQETGNIEVLPGAFMFLKTNVYKGVSGFDERYFMYGEDIDFSYTLLLNDYQNHYLPTVKVLHFKGESTIKDNKYLERFYGAMQLFYDKYFKQNKATNLLVNTGIKFWQTLNNIKSKQNTSTTKQIDNVLYIGSENKVFEAVKNIYNNAEVGIYAVCESRVISKYDDLDKLQTIVDEQNIKHLIFDAQNNSFEKIIFYMVHLNTGRHLTFAIRPSGCEHLIESHNKNTQGAVKQLTFC